MPRSFRLSNQNTAHIPYMPHSLPISFFLILLPELYWVGSIFHEAPHCAAFHSPVTS
jgi:hypothetical protein